MLSVVHPGVALEEVYVVLLVEHSRDRRVLSLALERKNYRVKSFAHPYTVLSALNRLDPTFPPPRFVLVQDHSVMSGFEVIERLRLSPWHQNTPMGILVNKASLWTRLKAWSQRVVCLEQPVDIAELVKLLPQPRARFFPYDCEQGDIA